MNLNDVKPGSDHAYFCRKNKVICHVTASADGDGACLIIETVLPDGDIMGPLFYSEACYLTPIIDLSLRCDKAYLMAIEATQLADLIECCCIVQEIEQETPLLTKGDDWKVNGDGISLFDFEPRTDLNAADLAAMTEALNNES